MLNMDKKLLKREEEGKVIRVGIVGAGQMGRGMVTQMVLMKGITPAIVSDIKIENAVHAFKYAEVPDEEIVEAKTLELWKLVNMLLVRMLISYLRLTLLNV